MENNRMIGRDRAIEILEIAIDVLDGKNEIDFSQFDVESQMQLISELKEIRQCIKAEKSGFHIWNAPVYDACFIAKRDTKLYFKRDLDAQRDMQLEYAFVPSKNERVESPLGEEWCEIS